MNTKRTRPKELTQTFKRLLKVIAGLGFVGFFFFPLPSIICTLYLAKPVAKAKVRGQSEISILKKLNIQMRFLT